MMTIGLPTKPARCWTSRKKPGATNAGSNAEAEKMALLQRFQKVVKVFLCIEGQLVGDVFRCVWTVK